MTNLSIQKKIRILPHKQISKFSRGFTLVELAIGIAVIGLIIGITAQLMSKLSDNNAVTQQENKETGATKYNYLCSHYFCFPF